MKLFTECLLAVILGILAAIVLIGLSQYEYPRPRRTEMSLELWFATRDSLLHPVYHDAGQWSAPTWRA